METHILTLPKRTLRLEIAEKPDEVSAIFAVDKVGDFGDAAQIKEWLAPLLKKYDKDPRPLKFYTPQTKESFEIFGTEKNSVGIYKKGI